MSHLQEQWLGKYRMLIVLGLALSAAACGDDTDGTKGTDDEDFTIVAPPGPHYGQTYAEWGATWWKWLYETPAENHPILDTTGANCAVGQPATGPFYLVGAFGGTETRDCTVPADRPLFFPIGNFSGDNCGVPMEDQLTDEQIIEFANSAIDFEGMSLTIDDTVVGDTPEDFAAYRTDATEYSYDVPAEGSLYAFSGSDFTGHCEPSYASGYWIMLEPLSAGHHSLNFSVHNDPSTEGGADGYDLDITYNLTIE
jgi:hypothetical protein